MIIVAIALTVALVVFLAVRGRSKAPLKEDADASAALDALVADAIERELAQTVLGKGNSTDAERAKLKKALRGTDADLDVVSALERDVKSVDLELVKFAHESDAEVVVTVAYEDGRSVKQTRRIALSDLPRSARETFEKKAITRVFIAWNLPWRR